MNLTNDHFNEINKTMKQIVALSRDMSDKKNKLSQIKGLLLELSKNDPIFNSKTMPPPAMTDKATNILYRLYEEENGVALYVNSASGRFFETPVHNHKTWAVLVGVEGNELNNIFERDGANKIKQIDTVELTKGVGLAFEEEDLHAICIKEPLLNLHLYGLGIESQKNRQYYDSKASEWVYFDAHPDIVEARMN